MAWDPNNPSRLNARRDSPPKQQGGWIGWAFAGGFLGVAAVVWWLLLK